MSEVGLLLARGSAVGFAGERFTRAYGDSAARTIEIEGRLRNF